MGRALAGRLNVRHLETDALVHGPDWTETPDAELRAVIEPILRSDGWVVDSDYRRKLGTLVLESADTVVWLDLPLRVCMRRLWGRTLPRITEPRGALERQPRELAGGVLRLGLALRLCDPQALRPPPPVHRAPGPA